MVRPSSTLKRCANYSICNDSIFMKLVIGSRTSALAMWQTEHVISLLQAQILDLVCEIVPFVTKGDKTLDKPLPAIGGKGLFTLELENALHEEKIDLAVHSLKDLPIEDSAELTLGAIIGRADVRDVIVAKNGWTLTTLPLGATVGTSSLRRKAQLLMKRPDLNVQSIRGNVGTRVSKVLNGHYDAAVLAAAGLLRIGLESTITEFLSTGIMLPAPGQGALGVQCRVGDARVLGFLEQVDCLDVRRAVSAERAFLHTLGGGCSTPVGAFSEQFAVNGEQWLALQGLVASVDGKKVIRVYGRGDDPVQLGKALARDALGQGAEALLGDE